MCKISLLILDLVQGGGFTSHWSGLVIMKACKAKMITMLDANFFLSGWHETQLLEKACGLFWSLMCLDLFLYCSSAVFYVVQQIYRSQNTMNWFCFCIHTMLFRVGFLFPLIRP